MPWRKTLRHLLNKVPKKSLISGYIQLIETMGDDEEERQGIAREMAVTIQAMRVAKGEIELDGLDEEIRKDVEATVKKMRAYVT